ARRAGSRVVAVGTTVVRALETVTDDAGATSPGEGWTSLVITPDRPLRSVSGLITGLQEPRATHLALLQSVIRSPGHLDRAYIEARRLGYLWHEFGDSHLILAGDVDQLAGPHTFTHNPRLDSEVTGGRYGQSEECSP